MSDASYTSIPGTDPEALGLRGPCSTWDPARYDARGRIGEGAVGVVVRVRDRLLNRTVAAKIVKPEIMKRPSTLARFVAEAQVGAQLQHPGIVPIYDVGRVADGRYYFTMPEVVGRSFGEILELLERNRASREPTAHASWTLWRVVDCFHRVCETLAYAHECGVIHRDLKPSNIRVGTSGDVVVLDWGIAKVVAPLTSRERPVVTAREGVDEFATVPGTLAGTPAYMSPEQARGDGDQVDQRSDVFALGAILWEILTGRPAFRANTAIATLTTILSGPPAHPVALRPDLPAALADICMTALAAEPYDRQRSARQLASQLATWLERGDSGHHPTQPSPVVASGKRITAVEAPAAPMRQPDPSTVVDATLSLETSPADARAKLFRFEHHDERLVPVPVRDLGVAPLRRVACEPGRWMLVLQCAGWHDAVYPLLPDDNHTHVAPNPVRLLALGELDTHACYVPEGWAHLGRHADRTWVDGFVIRRSPVTWSEYRAFLAELGPTDAVRHTPTWIDPFDGSARPLVTWHGDRPVAAFEADGLHDDAPATGITVADATAWLDWQSRRTQRHWRLPTANEWEKAGRGVDGRHYPWGARFLSTLTHCANDWSTASAGPVMHHPFDCSPYGVMDVAGNVAELATDGGEVLVCGESWLDAGRLDGPATRRVLPAHERHRCIGFRPARSL